MSSLAVSTNVCPDSWQFVKEQAKKFTKKVEREECFKLLSLSDLSHLLRVNTLWRQVTSEHFFHKSFERQFLRLYPINPDRKGRRERGNIVFHDSEILQKSHWIREKVIEQGGYKITARLSQNNKWVLPQIAIDGCAVATRSMLKLDHEREIDVPKIFNTHKEQVNEQDIIKDLESVNLQAEYKRIDVHYRGNFKAVYLHEVVDDFSSLIRNYGSVEIAIVPALDDRGWCCGGLHSILLDAIDNYKARIRDPFHAWEITLKTEAFLKHFYADTVLLAVTGYCY